jgi:hypothetical protein
MSKPTLSRAGAMGEIQDVAGPFEMSPLGTALVELSATRPEIVGLTADMGRFSDIHPFRDAIQNRQDCLLHNLLGFYHAARPRFLDYRVRPQQCQCEDSCWNAGAHEPLWRNTPGDG